ncbi:MAG TPA: efflux transporter periplasmic adaptor subunit, partial [Pseudolabrys sp.]
STKEGYKALFTVDAYPKRTFNGVVTQVRQSPQTVQNVVTYDVVVSVDNTDLALKPGMTAATRVISDQRDNALRVPSQALRYTPNGVRTAGGAAEQARVWALRDGKPVAIPIVAGLDDDSFVEIVKGDLKPDDRVVVSEQRDAAQISVPRPRL